MSVYIYIYIYKYIHDLTKIFLYIYIMEGWMVGWIDVGWRVDG